MKRYNTSWNHGECEMRERVDGEYVRFRDLPAPQSNNLALFGAFVLDIIGSQDFAAGAASLRAQIVEAAASVGILPAEDTVTLEGVDDPDGELQETAQAAHDRVLATGRDPYRFMVAVDIPAVSLERAYEALRARMLHAKFSNDWESTDENYYPSGQPVNLNTMQAACDAVIEREENS